MVWDEKGKEKKKAIIKALKVPSRKKISTRKKGLGIVSAKKMR